MAKLYSIEGNTQKLDGGAMFGNAPRLMWEKWIAPDELGRIPLACRALLVDYGDCKILFETGIGCFFEPKLAQRFGVQNPDRHMLLESLKAKSFSADEIDYVVLSHLHFDHAGGLLPTYQEIQNGNQGLVFSKAKFIVGLEAFARAENPHPRDRASYIEGLSQKLKDSGRLILVENARTPKELEGKVEFFLSNGHTPGQLHAIVLGQSKKIVFTGDLVPGTQWVHLPITMGYDRYAELVIDEKKNLYDITCDKDYLFFYTHDYQYSASALTINEERKFVAKDPIEDLSGFYL